MHWQAQHGGISHHAQYCRSHPPKLTSSSDIADWSRALAFKFQMLMEHTEKVRCWQSVLGQLSVLLGETQKMMKRKEGAKRNWRAGLFTCGGAFCGCKRKGVFWEICKISGCKCPKGTAIQLVHYIVAKESEIICKITKYSLHIRKYTSAHICIYIRCTLMCRESGETEERDRRRERQGRGE